jgi:hypothetical protein
MQKFDKKIGFLRKMLFFPPKIAENCDHNIDPRKPPATPSGSFCRWSKV